MMVFLLFLGGALLVAGTAPSPAPEALHTVATKYRFVYGTLVCGDACSPSMRRGLALYGEWQRAVFTFLARYIDEGAMIFDLLGGPGLGLVSFGHLLPTARIVSIEPRRDLYPYLSHNSLENAMFNRSLVGCFVVTQPAAPMAAINSGVGTERNAYDLYRMVNVCPAVVKIGDTPSAAFDTMTTNNNSDNGDNSSTAMHGSQRASDVVDSLLQALPLVAPCRPVFYVDNGHVDASYTIVRVLAALPGYNLYWHVSTALGADTAHRRGDNAIVVGLVAVPRVRDTAGGPGDCTGGDSDHGFGGKVFAARCGALRVPYEEGKFFLADYGLNLWLVPAPSPASVPPAETVTAAVAAIETWVTGSLARHVDAATCPATATHVPAAQRSPHSEPPAPPCAGAPLAAHATVAVHLDALLGPYPSPQAAAAAPAVPPLRFAVCLLPAAASSVDAIAAAHCTIWAHALPALFKSAMNGGANDDIGQFPVLARACAAFAAKQWELYHVTYMHNAALPLLAATDATATTDTAATTTHDGADVPSTFTPEAEPFKIDHQPDICGEPVWCNHTMELHRRLHAWQSPDSGMTVGQRPGADYGSKYGSTQVYPRTCANVRYLVFQPPSNAHGIGAMMGLIASAFRYALCLGRVFVLEPALEERTLTKWRHPGCRGSTFECYFRPLSDCPLSEEDLAAGHELRGAEEPYHAPVRDVRVLIVNNYPLAGGICKLCGDGWTGDRSFFDGMGIVTTDANSWYFDSVDEYRKATAHLDPLTMPLYHASTFLSATRIFFMSMFMRYLVRPRPWLRETLQRLVRMTLVRGHAVVSHGGTASASASASSSASASASASASSGNGSNAVPTVTVETVRVDRIPHPFVSMHVRYGAKIVEVKKYQPLERYMHMVKRKHPQTRHIFVSTETEAVIHELVRDNPGYHFYYLSYGRVEYLDLAVEAQRTHAPDGTLLVDFAHEFLYSLANLYVAVDGASGYVGSLSSSWCTTTNVLQRTRGDAGFDFLSVDRGSAYSVCF